MISHDGGPDLNQVKAGVALQLIVCNTEGLCILRTRSQLSMVNLEKHNVSRLTETQGERNGDTVSCIFRENERYRQ